MENKNTSSASLKPLTRAHSLRSAGAAVRTLSISEQQQTRQAPPTSAMPLSRQHSLKSTRSAARGSSNGVRQASDAAIDVSFVATRPAVGGSGSAITLTFAGPAAADRDRQRNIELLLAAQAGGGASPGAALRLLHGAQRTVSVHTLDPFAGTSAVASPQGSDITPERRQSSTTASSTAAAAARMHVANMDAAMLGDVGHAGIGAAAGLFGGTARAASAQRLDDSLAGGRILGVSAGVSTIMARTLPPLDAQVQAKVLPLPPGSGQSQRRADAGASLSSHFIDHTESALLPIEKVEKWMIIVLDESKQTSKSTSNLTLRGSSDVPLRTLPNKPVQALPFPSNKIILPKLSSRRGTVVQVVVPAVFGEREMARRKAEEKQVWRYSKMDENRRQVFFMNRLRAKELAERTRQELLNKLRHGDDEDEEEHCLEPTKTAAGNQNAEKYAEILLRRLEEKSRAAENYIKEIGPDQTPTKEHALRTMFIQDFVTLEKRSVQEYENYWDMRVRDINVVPRHFIRPLTFEEVCQIGWTMFAYLRTVSQPLFPYELGTRLHVIIETDWSTQEKLFEIQKLFSKLPIQTFQVLKAMLTHLCRMCVAMKTDTHLFRSIIYKEEKYMEAHPSPLQFSMDSLDAECDESQVDSEEAAGVEQQHEFDDGTEQDKSLPAPEITPEPDTGSSSFSEVFVHTGVHPPSPSDATKATTASPKRTVPRSVITSKYSGTRAVGGRAIEVENLWSGDGAKTIASSNSRQSYDPPPIDEAMISVPGFRKEPLEASPHVSFKPDFDKIEISKESPFSSEFKADEDSIDLDEEEAFDAWVLKAMQDAANAHRKQKGLPEVDYSVKSQAESQDEIWGEEKDRGGSATPANSPMPNRPVEEQPEEAFAAGIRIEITDTIEADLITTRTAPGTPTPASEMEALLDLLDLPMAFMEASHMVDLERMPVVVQGNGGAGDEHVCVLESAAQKQDDTDAAVPHALTLATVEFGTGDPDGFGWNLETKRTFATRLFLGQDAQTALAALLELAVRNVDVLFEFNTHIEAGRAAARARQDAQPR
ncbi:hypothetical protein HDU84_009134 [Entophlyctis sp. JEL0112]|nr:hypothetical protein HDU84_009134 [Entophlyctis sp. JEL0112]